ncbi:MAG: hypothetical protein HRU19_08820 [Pseudobacteriovorax sp.]|nr:hypothetical protein [Pseudobacteriovorax sp.]
MAKKDRESNIRQLISLLMKNSESVGVDFKFGRELVGSLATWAGKGKDEIVQIICREIGVATAAVMKEPISQMLSGKKLQLTLELVPKESVKKVTKTRKKASK